MAFSQYGACSPVRDETDSLSGALPTFGRILNAGGPPWDVLWEDGKVSSNLTGSVLDQVEFGTVGNVTPSIRTVKDGSVSSAEPVSGYYDGIVLARYERWTAGSIGNRKSYVLARTLDGGVFLEYQSGVGQVITTR